MTARSVVASWSIWAWLTIGGDDIARVAPCNLSGYLPRTPP